MDALLEGFWWGFGIINGVLWGVTFFCITCALLFPKSKPKPPAKPPTAPPAIGG